MTIEITKGDNNPVSKFFSSPSKTPETDEQFKSFPAYFEIDLFCRKLERERDEARKKLDEEMKWHHRTHQELVEAQCKLLDMEYDKLKS
jgi:hypothetical protein